MRLADQIGPFIASQLAEWPQAGANFAALADVKVKEVRLPGMTFKVQFNPARIASSGAKVDAATIKARKCFLCDENRPAAQRGIDMGRYTVLINPFPIFPRHLTIPDKAHTLQLIAGRMADMMIMAEELPGYTVFYNGPRCGASAPDHMHFQAGNSDFLTIDSALEAADSRVLVSTPGGSTLSVCDELPIKVFVIDAVTPAEGEQLFARLYAALPVPEGEDEPMMNILCHTIGDGNIRRVRAIVIPRKRHRPSFYGTEGEGCMVLSPASVDMGGVFITPRAEDFERVDAEVIARTLSELCLDTEEINAIASKIMKTNKCPEVKVGVVSGRELNVRLLGNYKMAGSDTVLTGALKFELGADGRVALNGESYEEVYLKRCSDADTFEVADVTIGVNFHWERQETQRFQGDLKVITEVCHHHAGTQAVGSRHLTLVNILSVEDYLKSVISSEMSATASPEFLRAHAVISRSWLLAQIDKGRKLSESEEKYCPCRQTETELIRWYDREDHDHFDVCADDHCQRYQGITRQTTPTVRDAVEATAGIVLVDNEGELCDARFSKSCGGVFEQFESCWEPRHHHYLEARRDSDHPADFPDLTIEENAREWILSEPDAYCNTDDAEILGQVLNNYDQETHDFYRWTVTYTQQELADLISRRSGIDFGQIKALKPVERGTSGRLVRMTIEGTKRTMTIGKELEIRRTLSPSHLYSSAFVVETSGEDIPETFTLRGAGWGHGVGLCQIGAAVMGARGCTYDTILAHYFPGSKLVSLY